MLVYGDQVRHALAQAELAAIRERLLALAAMEGGIERHAALASVFVAASELAQGLADAGMDAACGVDGLSPVVDAAADLLGALASALLASWSALGGVTPPPSPFDPGLAALDALAAATPSGTAVRLKAAEGYSFYALYPEAYAAAAIRLSVGPDATVIGVRSIGIGLAAMAASALDARRPFSVRPVGPPFERRLRLSPELEAAWRARADGEFVVVDEGPGLSGSSFGAVADALERLGARRERIHFLPGHEGDIGPQATAEHRVRWSRARRPVVGFDDLSLRSPEPARRLVNWFEDLAGSGDGRLEDVSGGGWRERVYGAQGSWPAADTFQERRKFLLDGADGRRWFLKFSGLGPAGERAFDHARRLGEAGWSPPALALRHGFIAWPWRDDARPLQVAPAERTDFAAHLGRYLAWRAQALGAPHSDAGADREALLEMARVNAVEALGAAAVHAPALQPSRWADAPPRRPVWTDNRLHAREWLRAADGAWLKTDAVDHAAAHDLVGPQDLAWDVAGAAVEWELTADERGRLSAELPVDAGETAILAALLEPAYLAFQLGAFAMAASAHAGWPAERARLEAQAARYRRRLATALGLA